jgi:hypothetical protein
MAGMLARGAARGGWLGRARALAVCAACGCSSSTTVQASGTPDAANTDASTAASGASDARAGGAETSTPPPMDAATADSGAATPPDASSSCGPVSTTWSRCAIEPLARAGYQQPDGRYELSIGDPDVQYDVDAGQWLAWWSTGLAAEYSDTPQLGIKYAHSSDGVAWTIQPALTIEATTSASDWDGAKVETPSVLIVPSNPASMRYLLYYSGAPVATKTVNGGAVTWYQIGLATSADGTSFTRLPASQSPYGEAGLVLEGVDAFPGMTGVTDGTVADPEIAWDGTTFHLFFSSMPVSSSYTPLAFGISHATSTDGIHWTPSAGNPIAALSGSKGSSVVRDADGSWEMFYQNDTSADLAMVPSTFNPQLGIWRATSPDLSAWTVPSTTRDLEWDGALGTEKYGWIAVGDMALVNGEYRYYYPAFSTLTPPSSDWVVPLQGAEDAASLIVLDMAQRL